MVDLERATVVGRGYRRVVYVDPDDPARCIKVPTAEAQARSDRQKALERERHYLKFYERKGRAMDQVSRYFGVVETTGGEGDVYELIRDHDGAIATTLAHQFETGRATLAQCGAEFEVLRRYLSREGIVVADLHAGNLARQEVREGEFRLVVIDGIGNTEFFKVSDYFRPAARRKVQRKWGRFFENLTREWGSQSGEATA